MQKIQETENLDEPRCVSHKQNYYSSRLLVTRCVAFLIGSWILSLFYTLFGLVLSIKDVTVEKGAQLYQKTSTR